MTSLAQRTSERIGEFDCEEQRIARDVIMEVPLFPDLPRRLREATGYGPHVDMMQHFVYWFAPRKAKMNTSLAMNKSRRSHQGIRGSRAR